MKKEDVKLGMKVVPHIGSIVSQKTGVCDMPVSMIEARFLYVVQTLPEDANKFGLSLINDYVVNETYFFQASDFEPFRAFCEPLPPFNFEECGIVREEGLGMLKEYCGAEPSRLEATTTPTEEELKERLENKELEHFVLMKHVYVVPDTYIEKSKTTEKDYKSFLEATVEEIKSKAARLQLEQDNIISFAELNGFVIDWETGEVTEKL